MIDTLLFGLPGDRPGGLVLTVVFFLAAAAASLTASLVYAIACTTLRGLGAILQVVSALLRGVPVLLLVFLAAVFMPGPVEIAALLGLVLYSWSHAGEILRGFLAAYPRALRDQARVMGMTATAELVRLRVPWTLQRALDALLTHWVSLLKDTGALVVLGIGELTTLARTLSETAATTTEWATVVATASALYLATTLALVTLVGRARPRRGHRTRREGSHVLAHR